MKTTTIFKTLAAAMLMPAMLLTASCSSEDDAIVNPENTAQKGYTLPVTVSVTRQADDATRATFNESTRKLEFSAGDQLFVSGQHDEAGSFAGTLDYVSDGTFSGTITIENDYSGTIDDLFTQGSAAATLLPAGYADYGYLSITSDAGYDDYVYPEEKNAFATSKATAVEQFSFENGSYTSGSGFALNPQNAILNFTITGLAKNTDVNVEFTMWSTDISKTVTTDDSGTATFAIGIYGDSTWGNEYFSLTVGGNAIDLVSSSKELSAGKIYNITRSVAPAGPTAYTLAESTVGMIVGTDGKAYDVADKDNLPSGVSAVAMVAYKDGSNGLAIQLNSSPVKKNWEDAKTYAEGLNTSTPIAAGTWRLPSKEDWQNMFVGCAVSGDASASNSMNPIAGFKAKIAATGTSWQQSGYYGSSTASGSNAWGVGVTLGGSNAIAAFRQVETSYLFYVLGCLAF